MLRNRQNKPDNSDIKKRNSNLPLLREINDDPNDFQEAPKKVPKATLDTDSSEDENGIPKEHPFYKKTDEEIHQIQLNRLEIEIKKSKQDEIILTKIATILCVITIVIGYFLATNVNFNKLFSKQYYLSKLGLGFSKKEFSCELWKKYSLPYTYSFNDYDQHIEFCRKYRNSYPDACKCKALNQPVYQKIKHIKKNYKKLAPILIISSCRPKYLYRTLLSLENAYYAYDHDIVVSTDCSDKNILDEINAVVTIFQYKSYKRLFYLKLVNQNHIKACKNKITHHYHLAIDYLLNIAFTKSEHFIVFEDDLKIAPDTLNYFYAHRDLLDKENPENPHSLKPTVWAISAWNDHSYAHTNHPEKSPSKVYRIDGFPGLGWMGKSATFRQELLPKWPLHVASDWDMWLRTENVKQGRVSLVPDYPRTFHFGEHGRNMNPDWHEKYYLRKRIYNHSPAQGDDNDLIKWEPLSKLSKNNYDLEIETLIKNSLKIPEISIAECSESNFMSKIDLNKSYVIRVNEDTSREDTLKYFKCLDIWDLDIRGLYMGILRIYYRKVPLTVVFCNVNVRFCAFEGA